MQTCWLFKCEQVLAVLKFNGRPEKLKFIVMIWILPFSLTGQSIKCEHWKCDSSLRNTAYLWHTWLNLKIQNFTLSLYSKYWIDGWVSHWVEWYQVLLQMYEIGFRKCDYSLSINQKVLKRSTVFVVVCKKYKLEICQFTLFTPLKVSDTWVGSHTEWSGIKICEAGFRNCYLGLRWCLILKPKKS